MGLLLTLLFSTLAVLISSYVIPGVQVDGFFAGLVAAVILGVVNTFIRPIISILTLPINIVTLGLFSFVISALMVMLTGAIVPGFTVTGFVPALLFAIVLSLVSGLMGAVSPQKE